MRTTLNKMSGYIKYDIQILADQDITSCFHQQKDLEQCYVHSPHSRSCS